LGFATKVFADIFKFPTPLFPRYKHYFTLGVRYDVPPLVKDITLRILFPKGNKYELQYVEYDFSGWKDGDSVTMRRNNELIFNNLFTKELAQRVDVRPVVKILPENEYILFQIHNETGTSKVLWLDLGLVAAKAITSLDIVNTPLLEIYPAYKKVGFGSEYQFIAFAKADEFLQEDVNFEADWTTDSPATIKNGLVQNTVQVKQYNVNATYNGTTSHAILDVVHAVIIEPSRKKVGQNHPYKFKVSTFDNISEEYYENPQAVQLSITEPAQIDNTALVTKDSEVKVYTVEGKYNGDTATAQLEVVTGLKIVPPEKTIASRTTYKFTAMQFDDESETYKDKSAEVDWTIDAPSVINNLGNTSNNLTLGDYDITAKDSYNNVAEAILHIVDGFKVVPKTQEIDEYESARFQALKFNNTTEQYDDVSSSSQWSSDIPLTSLDGGVAYAEKHGKYKITATYGTDYDTATLLVNSIYMPNPRYKIEPVNNTVKIGGTVQLKALFYDRVIGNWIDVTSQSTWSIINRGTEIKISSTGLVSGPNVEGEYEVVATYQEYTSNGKVTVTALPITHDYDYVVTMSWGAGDYDLRSRVISTGGSQLADIGFNSKTYTNSSGSVWLDYDDTNGGGTEYMTVKDRPGEYVVFYVQNWMAPTTTSVTCTIKTKGGTVLGTKTVSGLSEKAKSDIFKLDLGNGTVTVL
jgi:hypothetical protein